MTDSPTPQVVYNINVIQNKKVSDNRFLLTTTKPQNFNYLPGQFAILQEINDGVKMARPYSILSVPQEKVLMFYIKMVPEGMLTPKLYKKEPGDVIYLTGPYGHLTHLEIGVPDKLILIAMGSGIAAVRPLAKYYASFRDTTKLTIIHQARFRDNLIFYDELKHLGNYIPVLSKEKTNDALFGHFPEYKNKWFDKRATYVIVGKSDKVEHFFNMLASWGADKSRMYTEKY